MGLFYFQPLNERDPPMEPKDFWKHQKVLHQSLLVGAEKAKLDGKLTEIQAKKFIWSGKLFTISTKHVLFFF
jgi:hypothetical protein